MLKMLTKLFGLQTAATPAAVSKNIRYVTFRVDDEQAAAALHDWYQRRQDGLKTVQQYISDKFDYSLLKFNSPLFKLSEDGQLESVSYNGVIPLGWGGIPNTHWLAPQSPEAIKEVEALPPVATFAEMHKIIDWPTLELNWFQQSEKGIVRRVNHLVMPYGRNGETYIDVPHYDNFTAFPRIREIFASWQPPAWLKEMSPGCNRPGPKP